MTLVLLFASLFSPISAEMTKSIGDKIWENECGGKMEPLVSWNRGENFPSLGIGHFIWYPEGAQEPFQETFPEMIAFVKSQGAKLPAILVKHRSAPWRTREEFLQASEELGDLRAFLYETRHLQALYMAKRLEGSFEELLHAAESAKRKAVESIYNRLQATPSGLYALIDYLNFKGSGLSTKERYRGQGWGLLQVLERIPETSPDPLQDFARAAKELLQERVKNSPPERGEERWLKGWLNRVSTYLN